MARHFPAQDWVGRNYQDKAELRRKMNEMDLDELVLRSVDGVEFTARRVSYVQVGDEQEADFPNPVSTKDPKVREMARKDSDSRQRVVDREGEE